jgi:hypothetical protein
MMEPGDVMPGSTSEWRLPTMAREGDGTRARDWGEMRSKITDLLERRTGSGIEVWNRRIAETGIDTEPELRSWLSGEGVTGYPQMLLVMERFGYPDYLLKPSGQLIDEQYADRPALRPILDAVVTTALALGEVTVQARRTYVSLVTPRRAFALVRASTRQRVDMGLRLPAEQPTERLLAVPRGLGQDAFVRAIALATVDDVDDYVADALARAYRANA